MKIENIKFIADQIISYLKKVRNDRYRENTSRSINKARKELIKRTNWYTDEILGYDICDFKSKYLKPKNLQYPYLIREISSISQQNILYFQLIIFNTLIDKKCIQITEVPLPVSNSTGLNKTIRRQTDENLSPYLCNRIGIDL